MTDLYLIAHKVRGEPAFDIACQMICPECDNDPGCSECDGLGFWWIIPTSGHRAYPYFTDSLQWYMDEMIQVPAMPSNLLDHYLPTAEPSTPSLFSRLNLRPTQPPIVRRF